MPWSSTVVTREKLYDEVWSESVVRVAKRYGVSDVALRKVCVKLNVPVPPVGYWAKRAHGKATMRSALPPRAHADQHVFRRWVVPVDEELQTRLAAAQVDVAAVTPAQMPPDIELQAPPSAWHRTVKRTANALRNEFPRLADSWRIAKGSGYFSLYTSKASADRALSLLDLLVRLCLRNDLELSSEAVGDLPARVVVQGRAFTFRMVERANRGERELTEPERQALYRDTGPFVPNRVTKLGTGQLRLEVLNSADHAVLTRSDTRHQRLEDVVYDVPATLQHYAIEQAVREELAKERAERAEAERERRQVLIDIKKEQLERLEKTEKAAEQWLRARRLDRYARALFAEARSDEIPAEERARLLEEAQWTERAAAWLNPLAQRHWPEVDDAPDSPYVW